MGRSGAGSVKSFGLPVHDDFCVVTDEDEWLRPEFIADGPNPFWLTDLTEYTTSEGTLYIFGFTVVFSTKILGYSIDSTMASRFAVTGLVNAVIMRGDVAGWIVDSK